LQTLEAGEYGCMGKNMELERIQCVCIWYRLEKSDWSHKQLYEKDYYIFVLTALWGFSIVAQK
jgi:hypothetical protein